MSRYGESIRFSIHVRAKKAADVVKELSGLSGLSPKPPSGRGIDDFSKEPRDRGQRFAVSKERRGWVSVLSDRYPETASIAMELSRLLESDAFVVESRGGDQPSWMYRWFRSGDVVDSFDSSSLARPWDDGELDELMKRWQEDPAAAIKALQESPESSESPISTQRRAEFARLLGTRDWESRLTAVLTDESGNSVPEPVVASFLHVLGVNSGYAGISYAWLFSQHQSPSDLTPSGIRFAAHLA